MKSVVSIALALVAVVAAAPVDERPKILRSVLDQQPDGPFHSSFETENGITSEQHGELKQTVDEDNKPLAVVIIRGSYTYINDQGQPETITYIADEDGFHPQGASIPKGP